MTPAADEFSGPVPANLLPPLVRATDDKPAMYDDGCHVDQSATAPADCVYGHPDGDLTVALVGDSHAAQWFPALDRLADEHGWRLLPMTKSACSAADITVWNTAFERAYTECDQWREAVFRRLADEKPDLVIMSTSRGHQPIVNGEVLGGRNARGPMQAAIGRSLARFREVAGQVAMIADTPRAPSDPPVCLSRHLDDIQACATPREEAFNRAWSDGERATAEAAGVEFVDPASWVCPADPCPVVIGRYLVYRDNHHVATPLAEALRTRLLAALPEPVGQAPVTGE